MTANVLKKKKKKKKSNNKTTNKKSEHTNGLKTKQTKPNPQFIRAKQSSVLINSALLNLSCV